MKTRVMLINSLTTNVGFDNSDHLYHFPLGLLYIASVLEKHDIDVKIVDFNNLYYANAHKNQLQPGNVDDYIKSELPRHFEDFIPDIVGIGCVFSAAFEELKIIANKIKELFPNVPIAIGGIHASIFSVKILEKYDYIDYVIIDEAKAIEVIEAGLDAIRISVEHVSDEGYKRITKSAIKYDLIKKNVDFLFKEKEKRKAGLKIHVKMNEVGLSDFQKEKFIEDFSPISDSINFNPLSGWNNTYGYDLTLGLWPLIDTTSYANSPLNKDRKVCPDPFYSMSVNFNGLVSTCCADWSLGAVIGDAGKENIVDIWRGEKLRKFRLLHLEGKRDTIQVCSDCRVLQGAPIESDLDDDSEGLLKLYRQYTND